MESHTDVSSLTFKHITGQKVYVKAIALTEKPLELMTKSKIEWGKDPVDIITMHFNVLLLHYPLTLDNKNNHFGKFNN